MAFDRASFLLIALFAVPLVLTAQAVTTVTQTRTLKQKGPVHVEQSDSGLIVSTEGHAWKIDSATLPFLDSDCSPEAEAFNVSVRPDLRGCGHEPVVVASSLAPARFFFAVWVGAVAQNVQHVLFEADLSQHTVRRLLATDSSMGDALISPSGRYLAYPVGWSSGVCHQTSSLFIADLGESRGETKAVPEPAAVAAADRISPTMLAELLHWDGDDKIVIREATFDGDDSCKLHPWVTKTVRVSSLHFSR